jgi:hypothetical protein
MKPDVLTLTAIVFIAGVLISSLGVTDDTNNINNTAPPTALQQGIAAR